MIKRSGDIMEYQVVFRKKECELVEKVNSLIEEGWQPQGGVSAVMNETVFYVWLFQAMIRE